MKLNSQLILITLVLVSGCKAKNTTTEPNESAFPVLAYIQSQVAHVDTSLYSIIKLSYQDTLPADTVYMRREQFRDAAADFLNLADLSQKKFRKRYKEEKIFDESMNRVILRYTPVQPEKEDIQSEEILIAPAPSGDKVTSIFIDQVINSRDSSVKKRLLWQVDRSFTITTTLQKPGQPEVTRVTKVIWNEEGEE